MSYYQPIQSKFVNIYSFNCKENRTQLSSRYLLIKPAGPWVGLTVRFQVAWDMHCTWEGREYWLLLKSCFHLPNWHFPLSGSHKTFLFSYMKFLCPLKRLFIKSKSLQFLRKKKYRLACVGFDLGALDLQCITLTSTPPRICWQWMVWFEYI